ncbi:adenylosuccinate lyase [Candidatus Woesearchaeota archaeon]|nr:adenylosuccinate lyase [Candidatus Woesearchaeota archaeon]
MAGINLFDNISPIDFRYYGRSKKALEELKPYLSESAMIAYMAKVEAALAKALAKKGICPDSIAGEIERAAGQLKAEEVYAEEDRIKHNIRALANSIRDKVSEEAKPFVHFSATSHDIICSADAARFRDFTNNILVPALVEFEKTLIGLAKREAKTLQIGRTHGQHAEPITFGFAIAQYVSRLGKRIIKLRETGNNLRGKIAGAVGAYNASSLFIKDPEVFEYEVLEQLGIRPSPISTQVVEAEYMADYIHAVTSAFGILASLADDMRHLQRSEIAEVAESFGEKQVGSSTMPHKRNPINFENVKGMWKEFMPRMSTLYMDQLCEHQRDLTNSVTSRFVPEILAALYLSVGRLNRVMSKLVVDKSSLQKNFGQNRDMISAEPAYILLAAHDHPDAHEHVRKLTLEAQKKKAPFQDLVLGDNSLKPYLKKFTKEQLDIIREPEKYTGIAEKKALSVCREWEEKLLDM